MKTSNQCHRFHSACCHHSVLSRLFTSQTSLGPSLTVNRRIISLTYPPTQTVNDRFCQLSLDDRCISVGGFFLKISLLTLLTLPSVSSAEYRGISACLSTYKIIGTRISCLSDASGCRNTSPCRSFQEGLLMEWKHAQSDTYTH